MNSQTNIHAYMLVDTSGGRVELRQIGSSNIYEAQDSSYMQLDVTTSTAPVLRKTDGTQYTFSPVTINSEYRCTKIAMATTSATYNTTNGHLLTVTDTLQREIEFVYNGDNSLTAIRQKMGLWFTRLGHVQLRQVLVAPAFGGGLLVNGPNGKPNIWFLSYTPALPKCRLTSCGVISETAAFVQVDLGPKIY